MSGPNSPRDLGIDVTPGLQAVREPLSMVYGGGGLFGIAYTAGVAAGLLDAGLPVDTAPALGTSAGAWTAAAVALGLDFDVFADTPHVRVPNLRPGVLADVARALFGESLHPLVSVSAIGLRTRRRHILAGESHPLADLVAASSAVPGLFPPHRVDGRLYVDGGMWSATSMDAVPAAERVIVVAPLAGPVLGPVGHAAGLLLDRELSRWRVRHPGCAVHVIRPDRDTGRLAGRHPLHLFDNARARDVYPHGYEQGLRWASRLPTYDAA